MRTHTLQLFTVVILLFVASCSNVDEKKPVTGNKTEDSESADKQSTPATVQKNSKGDFREGSDYYLFERVRVHDNTGFDQPAEAFSLLLPKGWKHEGEIIWSGPGGSCDGTNSRFRASSADGKFSFEILPIVTWSWSSNEQLRQMQQQYNSSSPYCSYAEPLEAEQYLRNVFAPNELDNPEIIKITPNPDVVQLMAQNNDRGRAELMRYGAADVQFNQTAINADVQWPGNKKGKVMCGVSNIESTIPNQYNGTYDKSYTSQASQRVVFRYNAADEEQAERLLGVIMTSIRTNPYWQQEINKFWKNVREKKQMAHIEKIRNMDAQTRAIGEAAIRAGEERSKAMDNELRNWEARQQSQDRMHTNFIKTIREVENYRDETGKIELSAGYDHAWSRSDGTSFILSNNPNFDPSSVFQDNRWQEMKKVD